MKVRTLIALVLVLMFVACTPTTPPSTPPTPEAGDADPCATIQAVDQARIRREADGAAYNEPCP